MLTWNDLHLYVYFKWENLDAEPCVLYITICGENFKTFTCMVS